MTKLTLKNTAGVETLAEIEERQTQSELLQNAKIRAAEAHALACAPPTAESIRSGIATAMDALAYTFHQLEPRIVGHNGKHYRVDATLPNGVEDSGDCIDVNKWRYLQQQVTSVICWKLEDMLGRCVERVEDQRRQIVQARRQVEAGRAEESFVHAKIDFLDTLEEQEAMLATAFDEAKEAHWNLLGEGYETKAMRQERAAAVKAKPASDLDARLAARGFKS